MWDVDGGIFILVVYNFGQHFFLDHRHKFETQNELNIHYITQQSSNCLEVPPSETLRNIKRKSQLLTPQGTSSWFNRCSCINSSFAWHWSYGSLCKIPTRNMPNQSSSIQDIQVICLVMSFIHHPMPSIHHLLLGWHPQGPSVKFRERRVQA